MEILSKKDILYEQDYYLWLLKTSELLKDRNFDQVDIDNLIEEIDSMGRSEKKEVKSRLITLIEHLLKLNYWQSEKEYNARGWCNTIVEKRREIDLSLETSPSLRNLLDEIFLDCYNRARKDILKTYNLSSDLFPTEPPFSLEEVLDSDYLP